MRMSVLPKTPKSKPLHHLRRIVENTTIHEQFANYS